MIDKLFVSNETMEMRSVIVFLTEWRGSSTLGKSAWIWERSRYELGVHKFTNNNPKKKNCHQNLTVP